MKTQTKTRTLPSEPRENSKRKTKTQPNGETSVKTRTEGSASPSYDDIAARAYAIWKAQGCPQGQENEHWQQAVEELTASGASMKR
jgi:hypothetical protein